MGVQKSISDSSGMVRSARRRSCRATGAPLGPHVECTGFDGVGRPIGARHVLRAAPGSRCHAGQVARTERSGLELAETSTGRPVASARGARRPHCPTCRRRRAASRSARPLSLGRLDEVGAPVGDALEHGPDELGRPDAPGEPEQRARAPKSQTGVPSPRSAGTNQTSPVVAHRRPPRRTPRRLEDARGRRAATRRRCRPRASWPRCPRCGPPTAPGDDGEGPASLRSAGPGRCRRRCTGRACRPVPKVTLARPGPGAALADQRGLLVAGDARRSGARRVAPSPRRRAPRSPRCAGSIGRGDAQGARAPARPSRWWRRRRGR